MLLRVCDFCGLEMRREETYGSCTVALAQQFAGHSKEEISYMPYIEPFTIELCRKCYGELKDNLLEKLA